MKILVAIFLSMLLTIKPHAESLVISGMFSAKVSASNQHVNITITDSDGAVLKKNKFSTYQRIFLYDNGRFDHEYGDISGTYSKNKNTYILSFDTTNYDLDDMNDDGTYIEKYTPFQYVVKFNKKKTKAVVKRKQRIYLRNYYSGKSGRVSINANCNCQVAIN